MHRLDEATEACWHVLMLSILRGHRIKSGGSLGRLFPFGRNLSPSGSGPVNSHHIAPCWNQKPMTDPWHIKFGMTSGSHLINTTGSRQGDFVRWQGAASVDDEFITKRAATPPAGKIALALRVESIFRAGRVARSIVVNPPSRSLAPRRTQKMDSTRPRGIYEMASSSRC